MKDLSYSNTVYIQIKKLPLRLKQLAIILNPKQFTRAENFDQRMATLFVVVSLVLLAVASIAIQSLLLQQLSGTVLLSSSIYLLLHRRRQQRPEEGIAEASSISPIPQLNPSIGKILDISFWGLFIASITGWYILDPILALLVAAIVIRMGIAIIRKASTDLMDQSCPDLEQRIQEVLATTKGFIEYHDIRTRKNGNVYYAEFHLCVKGDMSVRDSHAMTDSIEAMLRKDYPGIKLNIHVESEEQCCSRPRE